MHLKKIIMMGAAVALFAGSLLNVSAAEPSTGSYVKALKRTGKENLIIDVAAYRAAYNDLNEAFGDNENAYVEHYLTYGVFEGRTKGILFDPIAYAAAYNDVRAAYSNDILALVNHYVTYGVTENRTHGTANGYADIAAAQENGSPMLLVQENIYNTSAATDSDETDAAGIANSDIAADGNDFVINAAKSAVNSAAPGPSSVTNNAPSYNHTTSIYEDNAYTTLLRVEYYDDNNKLVEYSDITYNDKDTNSYTETVYRYDEENQREVVTRTNTYENGVLVSSENH